MSDKKRLGRPYWTFSVDELRALMGVSTQKSYEVWGQFSRWVLKPAVAAINDYGTVTVKMTPEKRGRSVHAVRFDWHWKAPHEAAETVVENERHKSARRKHQTTTDAPPILLEDHDQSSEALSWWNSLSDQERERRADEVGRTFEAGGRILERRPRDIALKAFEKWTDAQ
ncbi:replication initiation protein [Breoghania sp. JC706]|uniref:replication initiation protein n=1 Tax=Breoghania sp. JC706 TaxID=3117732 RepID=UPI00300A9663